jgi:APA family basic amino acid/polyamine antiporter
VRRWIAIAAAVYALWALYGAGLEANKWGAVLIMAGVPVWWIMRRGAMGAERRDMAQ